MAEINLFSPALKKLKRRQKIRQLTWQLTLTLVLVLALLLVGLSGVSLLIARNNQATTGKIDSLKRDIGKLSPVESKQVYLLSKINTFANLLKTQEKHQAVAEAVFALLPDGTSLKGFQVAEDGLINLSGSVPDYPTLLDLLDRISHSDKLNVPVVNAKVNDITIGNNGAINFAIDVLIRT